MSQLSLYPQYPAKGLAESKSLVTDGERVGETEERGEIGEGGEEGGRKDGRQAGNESGRKIKESRI